ncbi:MAG: hypothetical protein H6652_11880 [Ardenticatenaceae bacterium]|nr:hypothetical protein [Ardenticatenaceae bacterium]MCB8949341.1 hypothetical protein [Ardenticatenaceae bacterium]
MAEFKKEQITRAFLANLYESLTALPDDRDGAEALPDDRFIAWCQPGLPFVKEDFLFATRGFGAGKGEGEAVRQRYLRAAEWSRLVNFVPDPSGIYDESGQKQMFDNTAFNQDGSSIVSIYQNVLNYSEVAGGDLSDDEKEDLKSWQSLLTETKIQKNLTSGEEIEVLDDSEIVKAYQTYKSEYQDAKRLYTRKQINALVAEDAEAIIDWALNEEDYRDNLNAALKKWVANGYRYQVEELWAAIDQMTRRSLKLWKDNLIENMKRAKVTDPVNGHVFYWTSLIPSTLPFSDGWQEHSFKYIQTRKFSEKKTNAWEGSVKIPIYSFFAKPSVSGETERYTKEVDMTDFSIKFEIAEAMIARPWLSPEFLLGNAWRFKPDMPNLTNLTETLSDGNTPPSGSMIAYPTTAIFVRNVVVDFKELHDKTSEFRRDISAKLSVSIGPFRVGSGSYSNGKETKEFTSEITEEGLKVSGMQLIGFKCKLLPKLPNPSPEVKEWA